MNYVTCTHNALASMAKLVRRHTSNVEIIGSNPIGSSLISLSGFFGAAFMIRRIVWFAP